jgi:hypothetical protein
MFSTIRGCVLALAVDARRSLAKPETGVKPAPIQQRFGLAELWRVAFWGFCAAFALLVAAYAGTTAIGRDRIYRAYAEIQEASHPSGIQKLRPLNAREGRQLAETVRALVAERETLMIGENKHLVTRIATLEHNVSDITGSIAREKAAQATAQMAPKVAPNLAEPAAAPAVTAPPIRAAKPEPAAPAEDATASTSQAAQPAPPPPTPLPPLPPSRAEFGVDLGRAASLEGLRVLWTAALKRHGPHLEGLRPIVHLRERPRPPGVNAASTVELHLVVGPLATATTAARLCAAITAAGGFCQPAPYDGQRLALR